MLGGKEKHALKSIRKTKVIQLILTDSVRTAQKTILPLDRPVG